MRQLEAMPTCSLITEAGTKIDLVPFEPASLNGWPAEQVYVNGRLCGAVMLKTFIEATGDREWMVSFDTRQYLEWFPNLPSKVFALKLFEPPQC